MKTPSGESDYSQSTISPKSEEPRDGKVGPLHGMKVLDLTQYVAGPFCSMILGDLGAEVIKVEMAGRGDIYRIQGPNFINGEATSFLSINRNKKSLTLNLKDPGGLEIIHRLIPKVDIFLQNFKPGTAERLGVGYKDLYHRNPRLIYACISGYGQTGPDSERGGYDLMAQGRGGLMSVTGTPDGPPVKVGVPVLDMGAAMYAALGILAAYNVRERTGQGQMVDVALMDTAVSWLTMLATDYQATGIIPGRMGSASPFFAPYQAFRAKDGFLTVIGTGGKDHWQRFCRVLDREEWIDDPRFMDNANRIDHLAELTKLIEGVMSTASVEEWLERLEAEGLACDPIQTLDEVLEDPQVHAREMVVSVDHPSAGRLKMTGVPIKFSATPGRIHSPPPTKGQHTDEILKELGFDDLEISVMHETGVV